MIIKCDNCKAILGNLKDNGIFNAMNNLKEIYFTGNCIARKNEVEAICKVCNSKTQFIK